MQILKSSKTKLLLFTFLFISIALVILFGLYTRGLDNEINYRSCVNSIENAMNTALKSDILLRNEFKINNDGRFLSIEEINRVFQKIPLNTNYDCNQIYPINNKTIKNLDYLVVFAKVQNADVIVSVKFKQ